MSVRVTTAEKQKLQDHCVVAKTTPSKLIKKIIKDLK